MKDKTGKLKGIRERDDALMNFVVRQAQEAILNPNLPEKEKDAAVESAISSIQKVAESKAAYYAKYGGGRRTRRPRTIYEAESDYQEEDNTPPIITELNENLQTDAPDGMQNFTVQWIAERAGISKNILYEWVESDSEFTTALGRLKDAQENDPLKTSTEEDYFVNSMMIALLLMETRDRHFRSENF